MLESVLMNGAYKWGSNIIFTGSDLYGYYGMIMVSLLDRGSIVGIPMSAKGPFHD